MLLHQQNKSKKGKIVTVVIEMEKLRKELIIPLIFKITLGSLYLMLNLLSLVKISLQIQIQAIRIRTQDYEDKNKVCVVIGHYKAPSSKQAARQCRQRYLQEH